MSSFLVVELKVYFCRFRYLSLYLSFNFVHAVVSVNCAERLYTTG